MSIYSIEDGCDEDYVRYHLENYCQEANITEAEFNVERCSKKGDNFIGLLFRVVIEGKLNGNQKTVHAVLKLATRNKERRKIVGSTRPFFLREIFFFKTVVPLFKQAEVELTAIPELLYSNEEECYEALLLEDLSVRGYFGMKKEKNENSREAKLMDYDHAVCALRRLGKFHAKSFIVRKKRPDIFKQLQAIKEPLFSNFSRYQIYVDLIFKIMEMTFDKDTNKYRKLKFKLFHEHFFEYMDFVINGENAEPYAVVCHGDFWSGNMLFKYNEESGCPEDFYFLDFQICRYASPVTDITYSLFCCCCPDVRQEKFDDLLKNYHDSLSEALKEVGLDPDDVFSYDTFMQQMHKFAIFCGVMAVFVSHLFTAGENDVIPEIGKTIENFDALEKIAINNDVYRKVVKNLFYDLIDKYYI